jgi:hypothetical protein
LLGIDSDHTETRGKEREEEKKEEEEEGEEEKGRREVDEKKAENLGHDNLTTCSRGWRHGASDRRILVQ